VSLNELFPEDTVLAGESWVEGLAVEISRREVRMFQRIGDQRKEGCIRRGPGWEEGASLKGGNSPSSSEKSPPRMQQR